MSWIAFVTTCISIVSAIVSYLKDQQAIESGVAEAVAAHLQGALDELKNANKARSDVDARTSGPDATERLRDDPANLYRD
ncbi:MAG TPA: hypothetical protein VGN16_09480 [Acidobacteriaceae bacterium]|jgi:hypothetical protein